MNRRSIFADAIKYMALNEQLGLALKAACLSIISIQLLVSGWYKLFDYTCIYVCSIN